MALQVGHNGLGRAVSFGFVAQEIFTKGYLQADDSFLVIFSELAVGWNAVVVNKGLSMSFH